MLIRLLSHLCLYLLLFVSTHVNARSISFDLENTQGQVTQASFPNKYMLLALGYTSCPDICPTTLYEFASALDQLEQPDAIVPIFVSIDPTNDTAETMQSYAHYFDKRIIGLTGSIEKIKDLTSQLGATFGYRLNGKKIDIPTKGSGYTVYHSSLIYLINPNHELVDVFDYQIGANDLAKAINKALSINSQGSAYHDNISSIDHTEVTTNHPPITNTNDTNCPLPNGFTPLKQNIALKDIYPESPKHKVVLLNLWATWCAPCRIELPILDKFAQHTKELDIYTLNLGNKKADIDTLFESNKIHHLSTHSVQGTRLLKQLGGRGLPFNVLFIDGQQIAIKHGIIDETESLTTFAQCINKGDSHK